MKDDRISYSFLPAGLILILYLNLLNRLEIVYWPKMLSFHVLGFDCESLVIGLISGCWKYNIILLMINQSN